MTLLTSLFWVIMLSVFGALNAAFILIDCACFWAYKRVNAVTNWTSRVLTIIIREANK